MIQVRRAETDPDFEGWIRVKRAVLPNESAWTVEEFRTRLMPDRTVLVAELDGEIVGYSGLMKHDNEGVAEDGLTVVRRVWRRRGLGKALKQRELAWAKDAGLREVVTWTQSGNDSMRTLNERLGYEYRDVALTMSATLPLENETAL